MESRDPCFCASREFGESATKTRLPYSRRSEPASTNPNVSGFRNKKEKGGCVSNQERLPLHHDKADEGDD